MFSWGDSYDSKVIIISKWRHVLARISCSQFSTTQDWDRLRTIIAPTLMVLMGLGAFYCHVWLMAKVDRLSPGDG